MYVTSLRHSLNPTFLGGIDFPKCCRRDWVLLTKVGDSQKGLVDHKWGSQVCSRALCLLAVFSRKLSFELHVGAKHAPLGNLH